MCIAVIFKRIANVSCSRFLQRLQNILMLISFKHSLPHNYFMFWFQFVLVSYFWKKKQILYHQPPYLPTSGLCLTQLDNVPLSQKVHILLEWICPSITKIFQSIFTHSHMKVRILAVNKFPLCSNCVEYNKTKR